MFKMRTAEQFSQYARAKAIEIGCGSSNVIWPAMVGILAALCERLTKEKETVPKTLADIRAKEAKLNRI